MTDRGVQAVDTGTGRIQSIDHLRGVAALAVCLSHVVSYSFARPLGGLLEASRSVFDFGWLGVEVFFVISGFVIPWALFRAEYRARNFGRFIAKRMIRLDPPYFAAVLLSLALGILSARQMGRPYSVDLTSLALHVGYLNGIFGHSWLNPVFWTLAIEFQYYLLVGIIFPLIVSPKRSVRILLFASFVGMYLLFDGSRTLGSESPSTRFIFHVLPLFCMGIAAFQFRAGIVKTPEFLILSSLATLGGVWVDGVPAAMTAVFTVATIMLWKGRSRLLEGLGEISYSLYLVQWPVLWVAVSVSSAKLFGYSDVGIALSYLSALIASLVAARTLYVTVERPAQRLARRWAYEPDRPLRGIPLDSELEVALDTPIGDPVRIPVS
jgi:peptidoglycan/LPS O-acetylase OafA/YrhL